MTLKNLKLSPNIISNLFKDSLIGEFRGKEKNTAGDNFNQNFFGGNNKNILLLINNIDVNFLPEKQILFLSEILSACNLSLEDIAIVNLNKLIGQNFKNIPERLNSQIIILSDVELSMLELPFKIPLFQIQQHKEKKYVSIPSLQTIQNDTVLKKRLWSLLQVLFSL